MSTLPDYKRLLIKYVVHVGSAEGIDFATSVNLSPAGMGDQSFTDEEKAILESQIFAEARRINARPYAEWGHPS